MPELQLASWDAFKETCITRKNLNCQYSESAERYELYGPDANNITWHLTMLKFDPRDQDQADFEDNHKAAFNWAIGMRLYPASTPDAMFHGECFSGIFDKSPDGSETATDLFFRFDHPYYLSGAMFWTTGAKRGDCVQVDIVDKDNLLQVPGFDANNPTLLSDYIEKWNILPVDNQPVTIERPYWAKPPAGMYMRLRGLIKNTISDVTIDINFFIHKPL